MVPEASLAGPASPDIHQVFPNQVKLATDSSAANLLRLLLGESPLLCPCRVPQAGGPVRALLVALLTSRTCLLEGLRCLAEVCFAWLPGPVLIFFPGVKIGSALTWLGRTACFCPFSLSSPPVGFIYFTLQLGHRTGALPGGYVFGFLINVNYVL